MIVTPILSLRNVDVVFNDVIQVLHSLSLEVRHGQIVALIGANGAGKTTTLKAISSLLSAERGRVAAGQVLFDGSDFTSRDPAEVARQGIIQMLEGRKVLRHLSVEQNLRVGAHFRTDRDAVRADFEQIYAFFPPLVELRERTAGFLSGGEMQ